jgi:hypothetical protein
MANEKNKLSQNKTLEKHSSPTTGIEKEGIICK